MMRSALLNSLAVVAAYTSLGSHVAAWQQSPPPTLRMSKIRSLKPSLLTPTALSVLIKDNTEASTTDDGPSTVDGKVEETTEKYGLEAGLFQSLRQEDGGESAKSLLKKYGIAYLATSIPLALVSFGICYALVSSGVDVSSLLSKLGIEQNAAAENAGTFAIAYAAHKAASPIRFPPTVILTPLVAKLIGKEPEEEGGEKE